MASTQCVFIFFLFAFVLDSIKLNSVEPKKPTNRLSYLSFFSGEETEAQKGRGGQVMFVVLVASCALDFSGRRERCFGGSGEADQPDPRVVAPEVSGSRGGQSTGLRAG